MERREFAHILAGVLVLFVVSSLFFVIKGNLGVVFWVFIFSFIIIGVHVFSKKIVAYLLDSNVEHRIWHVYQYGLRPKDHFKEEVPFGLIAPLFLSVLSAGILKFTGVLTYESRALKHRAAKRFGFYSFTEVTDWHNGLIGSCGIIAVLILSVLGYSLDFEYLAKMAAYYALSNMIPISNLDGTLIFFGSRIMWSVLALVSALFAFAGFLILV